MKYQCKYPNCTFETDKKGELLSHYRWEHEKKQDKSTNSSDLEQLRHDIEKINLEKDKLKAENELTTLKSSEITQAEIQAINDDLKDLYQRVSSIAKLLDKLIKDNKDINFGIRTIMDVVSNLHKR